MAYSYNWKVYIQKGGVGSWVEITDIQQISFSYGQHQLTDTWSPPIFTISGRRPDLLGTINIGDLLSISNALTTPMYQVTSYEINYGIKSSMDTWTITAEGPFSALARSVVSTSWGSVFALDAATNVLTAANLSVYSGALVAPVSAQTINNENGFDVFTRIARTSGTVGFDTCPNALCFATDYRTIYFGGYATGGGGVYPSTPSYTFTDATLTSTECVYDNITFGSINLNYANKVIVTPVGGSPQTVGTGNTAFETSTYSSTNANALLTANYYTGLLAASQQVPTSISFTLKQQQATATVPNQEAVLNSFEFIKIVFRGSTYYAKILGQEMSATPENQRVTLHLCASETGNFFTLDSAALGVLDQNRLGI